MTVTYTIQERRANNSWHTLCTCDTETKAIFIRNAAIAYLKSEYPNSPYDPTPDFIIEYTTQP